MHTTRRTVTAAMLGVVLLLTGCGNNGSNDNDDDRVTETEAVTATEDPEARQAEVAAQVIEFYNMAWELRDEDEMLDEDAREVATYSWIDKHNSDMDRLRAGGRSFEALDATVTDHQVLSFNDTASDADAWTIRLNLCVDSRSDYRDEDGTVIDDPDQIYQGAVEVIARYDGPNDVWKLTDYQLGDSALCGYESLDGTDDADATTEGS